MAQLKVGTTIGGQIAATQNWVNGQNYLTTHPTISAASSSNNSGRTYIQDIILDANGHVTGIATGTETVVNTDTNYYTTGATFNTGNGIITGTRNDGGTWTVDIDGRFLTSYSETDTLSTVTSRGNTTTTHIGVTTASPINLAASGNLGTWIGGIQDATAGWSITNNGIGLKADNSTYAGIVLAPSNGLLYFGRTSGSGVGTMSSWLEVNSSGTANFRLSRPQHNGSNLALVSEIPTNLNQLTNGPGYVTHDYYTTGSTFNSGTGIITFTRNDGGTYTVNIASTLTDVTVTGGTYNSSNQTLTLTKSNGTTVSVSGFAIDTDVNWYTTSASFNTGNGIITGTRNDGGTWTVDIDGKYLDLSGGTLSGQVIFPSAATTKPVLPSGFISRDDSSDGNHDIWGISERYYPSNSTAADAWGIRWNGDANDIQFVGSGTNVVTISLDEGNITTTGTVTASGGNSGNWNTAYSWGNHAGLYAAASHTHSEYLKYNPDGDGIAISYDDSNPTVNGTSVGGGHWFGADGSTGNGYLAAKILHAQGSTSSIGGYFTGAMNISAGGNSTQVIDGSGNWVGNAIGDSKISSSGNWNTAYGWGDHSTQGYLTSVTNISGYAGTLLREDNRTISPSELAAGQLKFGFVSWDNNNGTPYADFLHMRSYTDSSGGSDNLVMFKKSGIGMRIWQQSWGSSTAYSSYVDVWTSGDFTSTNVSNWNTAYGWGNHASAGYLTSLGTAILDGDFTSNGLMKRTGAGTYSVVTDNSSNWNTAYGWGNHASAGYASSSHTHSQLNNSSGNGYYVRYDNGNELNTYDNSNVSATLYINYRGGSVVLGQGGAVTINTSGVTAPTFYATGGDSSNWNTAYSKRVTGTTLSASTLTIAAGDGTTVTASVPTFNQNTTGNAATVTINYNNDSNSTYQMLWGSGNSVFGTAGVYVNPSTDYVTATSFNASDWFRSSGATGWYNSTYGGGWYMTDTSYVRPYNSKSIHMGNASIDYVTQLHFNDNVRFYDEDNNNYLNYKWGNSGAGGIKFRDGDDSIQGYVYGSGTGSFGLLDGSGNWKIRLDTSDVEMYGTQYLTTVYAYTMYDRNNSAYYVNPAESSNLSTLTLNSPSAGSTVLNIQGTS